MFQKTLILVVIFLLSSLLFSQSIENGSLAVSGVGWDTTSGEGRENGPYMATFTYQASINSPFDINPTSGSGLVTLTSTWMSDKFFIPDALIQRQGIFGAREKTCSL